MTKTEVRDRVILMVAFLVVAGPLWLLGTTWSAPLGLLAMIAAGLWRARCHHPEDQRRCIHGDEITAREYARAECTICGRAKKSWPLPEVCSVTGKRHNG